MNVQTGSRLGPYEIVAHIGAGGMGEVWRGRDTRLDREVAIKILPAHLAGDPGFKARFEREARLISSLNHPNICTLHDLGSHDGRDFLVLEYCEGESLADRLVRGPLPVDQVLRIAMEVAAALDRAHRSGIVHRDLKPGNIVLTKGGAKLLDFGLAKPSSVAGGGSHPVGPILSMGAATEQKPLTAEGVIVGTFQYMAPEQVEGKEADGRTDIFSFGAILYEMITGKRAFDGKTRASLIASILDRQPPPISEVQPLTPPALDRVIRTALQKDPDDRWQTAHDLLLQLRWIAEAGSQAGLAAPVVARRRNRERMAWTVALLFALAAVAAAAMLMRVARRPLTTTRTEIMPPRDVLFAFDEAQDDGASMTISPDGRYVTFAAVKSGDVRRLWMQPLDSLDAIPLSGTEEAECPFWSPDSRFIAFFSRGKLRKVDPKGGPALVICDAGASPRGGAWNRDGVIVFAPDTVGGLHRVSAAGGKPVPLTKVDTAAGHTTHRWATFLPDQQHFLYVAGSPNATKDSEKNAIFVGSLDGSTNKMLLYARSNVAVAAGHLLWMRNDDLVAQQFDPAGLTLVEGEPAVIASGLRFLPGMLYGAFSVASNGTLVYVRATNLSWPLAWFDRSGKRLAPVADAEDWGAVVLSPDGGRFVATINDPSIGTPELWLFDLTTKTRTRLTNTPIGERSPVWSPDGKRLAYSVIHGHDSELLARAADGSGDEELLFRSSAQMFPTSWSPDGQYLVFSSRTNSKPALDIWLLPMDGSHTARPFLQSPHGKTAASVSHDGRWLSYSDSENGVFQCYVTSFPSGKGKWRIQNATAGIWSRGGRELLFLNLQDELWSLSVGADSTRFTSGPPQLLSKWPGLSARVGDIARDGERILLTDRPAEAEVSAITVVTNWTTALPR